MKETNMKKDKWNLTKKFELREVSSNSHFEGELPDGTVCEHTKKSIEDFLKRMTRSQKS